MSGSKQLSFVADKETVDLIEKLKKDMRAPTTAALFRKLLALGELATERGSASNGVVTLRGKSEPQSAEVSVSLKM